MSIPREVVLDLLPLYVAGEVSPASRALIEEYLRGDPELAARARALESTSLDPAPSSPAPEIELKSIERTRRLIAAQRWLLGFGLCFSSFGLAMQAHIEHGRITEFHFLLRDFPVPLGLLLAAGVACLVGYVTLRRRLRYTAR